MLALALPMILPTYVPADVAPGGDALYEVALVVEGRIVDSTQRPAFGAPVVRRRPNGGFDVIQDNGTVSGTITIDRYRVDGRRLVFERQFETRR